MRNKALSRTIAGGAGALLLLAGMAAPAAAYPRPGTTERVSATSDGSQADGSGAAPISADARYVQPAISADGRHVAFSSLASNLVPGDANGARDVFVHDRATGTTERVSVASDGTEAIGESLHPAISADGRQVAFESGASNLVPGDPIGARLEWDVYVHDRATGTTEWTSVASDGTWGNGNTFQPALSGDGRFVTFHSEASNFVSGDTNGGEDVFVRDRGPATGVGAIEAHKVSGELLVSGWATFSGVTVTSAEDPPDDGVRPPGTEIIAASVTYRTEQEDLLMRMDLASLPGLTHFTCPAPGVCAGVATGGGPRESSTDGGSRWTP